MYRYIIAARGYKAIAVHSELNYFEFKDFFETQCKKIHPLSNDKVWNYGIHEFFNPTVFSPNDFADFGPALMGFKKGLIFEF